jgi:hypothetical protein
MSNIPAAATEIFPEADSRKVNTIDKGLPSISLVKSSNVLRRKMKVGWTGFWRGANFADQRCQRWGPDYATKPTYRTRAHSISLQ